MLADVAAAEAVVALVDVEVDGSAIPTFLSHVILSWLGNASGAPR